MTFLDGFAHLLEHLRLYALPFSLFQHGTLALFFAIIYLPLKYVVIPLDHFLRDCCRFLTHTNFACSGSLIQFKSHESLDTVEQITSEPFSLVLFTDFTRTWPIV
jgi:hypothetical protein